MVHSSGWPTAKPCGASRRGPGRRPGQKAELGWVRFDDLRHLALTLLAEEGVPFHVIVIKAFADHADIKVTERYLHARRGPMDEAARKLEERYRRGASHSPQRSSDTPSS